MSENILCRLIATVFVSWYFLGCSIPSKIQKDKERPGESNSNLLISIQQGTCSKKCPVYSADFYSGKKLIYSGISRMPLIGKYQFLVPDELTKNLIFEAIKLDLKSVPDSTQIPEGASKIIIRIVLNGSFKQIVGSTVNGDERFKKFVKLLHTEVNALIVDQEGLKLP